MTLERLVLSLNPYQTVYKGMFYKKTHIQEILNFRLKSWVNPFGKMQLVRLFENDLFYSKAYSIEKLHMKETLNF